MKLNEFRDFCRSLPQITEEFPFDEVVVTYKVGGKIFALTDIKCYEHVSVKCDPEDAMAYREIYESVIPGYHLNKRHWNSILTGGDVPDETLKGWIRDSYNLVVKSLTKKMRDTLFPS